MATDKIFNSTPVESVGSAEDVLNVTAVEEATAEVQSAPQTDLDAAAEAVAADFAEEDAALAAEQAGLAIEGETAEEEAAADIDRGDVNGKSKQELVDMFAEKIASEPVQTLRKSVEAIKIAFYKLHRAEVDAARKAFEATEPEKEFVPAPDALEARLKDLFKEYRRRRDALCGGLRSVGWEVRDSGGTMFVFAPLPTGYTDSAAFCDLLLERAGVVCTPGIAFGRLGEGYVRFALTRPVEDLEKVVALIADSGIL